MTNNPFNPRPPKQINPRFSLSGGGDGTDTEEFASKASVPERAKRPAPRPIGAQADSPAPAFVTPATAPPVSPNSMFANDGDDDLNLDLGVNENETELRPAAPVKKEEPVIVPPVPETVEFIEPVVDVEDDINLDVGVSEDDDLNLDVGVNDAVEFIEPVVEPPVVPMPEPVQQAPVEAPKVVVPPVKPAAPSADATPKKRAVNPMFADYSPDEDDDDGINLDVGVNDDASAEPAKRSINSRFDFKNDKSSSRVDDPDRLPSWKKTGPLMDVADGDDFKKDKSKRNKRTQSTGRRGFQIQERDIVLLRFLTKYQFSYVDAIARVLNSTPQTISNRLRTLEEYDLVKRQVIAAGSTLWQTRKSGIELAGMSFTENKKSISFATIRHTIGLVNLAAELEREAPDAKDILGLSEKYGESFPVMNRWPGGVRLYGEDTFDVAQTYGEMTVAEREIRQGQKRYRGGKSSQEMRDLVDFAILNPEAPELEEGNEGLFVVYGTGGKTGEHVPDLVVTRPRNEDGTPNHFAVELELTAKSPSDWKRILRSYREAGGMYSRIYYFTPDKPIANMIRNANEDVGLGDRLVICKYTPKNKRQPFLG